MILIFGGAYQGKLAYVKEKYEMKEQDIFFCEKGKLDMDDSKDVMYGLEHLIWELVKREIPYEAFIEDKLPGWKNKIIVCEDNSCGVVPIDPLLRQYRETQGRVLSLLSKNAEKVVRMFCGLESLIK
ncbi:MAG: bifunctional adenosylcobinamide kinase/adenosylcobinamide-phosphate guanylyltransferase [Acetivibrio sp.]